MKENQKNHSFGPVEWKTLELITPVQDLTYIYFLYTDSEDLAYVGQTFHIMQRISSHMLSKRFKTVKYFLVPSETANEVEAEMIILYQPYLNYNIPVNRKYTYLNWFQQSNPCLKGKMVKIKQAIRKLEIKSINGYYLIDDLNKIIPLVDKGGAL